MPRLSPVADSAVLVEFDTEFGAEAVGGVGAGAGAGNGAGALARSLETLLVTDRPAWLLDTIPGIASLLVEYDGRIAAPAEVWAAVASLAARTQADPNPEPARVVVLPVCFDAAMAPDLDEVAQLCGVSPAEVIEALVAADHRVAILGNQPGLPYLTGPAAALPVARMDEPRGVVAAGSLGLAAGMACIYPMAAPGGWRIVGRTPARLFDAARTPPCLVVPGDRVRIEAIDVDRYRALEREAATGRDGSVMPAADEGAGPGDAMVGTRRGDHDDERTADATAVVRTAEGAAAEDAAAEGTGMARAGDAHPMGRSPGSSTRLLSTSRSSARRGLRVIAPGLLITIQDAGRRGWQRLGVPPSGAADPEALLIANRIVGNPPNSACLEVTGRGPVLEAIGGVVTLGVAGACQGAVWRVVQLGPGEALDLGRVLSGLRATIAVSGGIDVNPVLGSRSTHLRSGIGPLGGRGLQAGDVLAVGPSLSREIRWTADGEPPWRSERLPLRIVLGPHRDHLDRAGLAGLLDTPWTVSPRSDRIGLRLDGPRLQPQGGDVDSYGCGPGVIQLPPAGLPIILGPDRGTTGGYPAVATVIAADLSRLGQLRPGAIVTFAEVDVATAASLRALSDRRLDAWVSSRVGRA